VLFRSVFFKRSVRQFGLSSVFLKRSVRRFGLSPGFLRRSVRRFETECFSVDIINVHRNCGNKLQHNRALFYRRDSLCSCCFVKFLLSRCFSYFIVYIIQNVSLLHVVFYRMGFEHQSKQKVQLIYPEALP
jgi:hypothetical protein